MKEPLQKLPIRSVSAVPPISISVFMNSSVSLRGKQRKGPGQQIIGMKLVLLPVYWSMIMKQDL
jgi:hypothetical protein